MKKLLLFILSTVMLLSLSILSSGENFNDDDLTLSRIIIESDPVVPYQDIVTRVNVDNIGNIDLENVKITVVVPELGLRRSVGPFDVNVDDVAIRRVVLDLFEEVQPGEYYVKITAEDKNHRKSKYRLITVQ
jgi:hypothetical protein